MEHTNIDLVVRLFNGPLETAIGAVAGNLAEALRERGSAIHLTNVNQASI